MRTQLQQPAPPGTIQDRFDEKCPLARAFSVQTRGVCSGATATCEEPQVPQPPPETGCRLLNTNRASPSPASTKSISTPRMYSSVPGIDDHAHAFDLAHPVIVIQLIGKGHTEADAAAAARCGEHANALMVSST